MPDGRPFWGGTYFPKENWIEILTKLAALYKDQPEKAEEYAANLTRGVRESDLIEPNTSKKEFSAVELDTMVTNWKKYMDFNLGGRAGAPKFPMPNNYQFLLRYAVQHSDQKIMDYVNKSLTKMALGGINDQIGGGFARYAVDNKWHIPHFEKMLYDNGQLLSLYANAYLVTKNQLYKEAAYQITTFAERELLDKTGAFYSSLDADSKNTEGILEEGAFYVWKKNELQNLLKEDFDLFAEYYNINDEHTWEHDTYNPHRTQTDQQFAEKHKITPDLLKQKTSGWKDILFKAREKRSRPRLDDKILTSWNALMLKGYIDAYRVFNDEHFLKIALKNASFIQKVQIQASGELYRNFKNGKSTINAYLEDYATVIDAFINLYQITLDEKWLETANQLAYYCFDHFFDDASKMFFFTSNTDRALVARKIDIDDNVIPSSNSVMANNLFLLGHYYANKTFTETAEQMLHNVKDSMLEYGSAASNWSMLYMNLAGDFYEIAITGEKVMDKLTELNQYYIPNKLVAGSKEESKLSLLEYKYNAGETTIYVCVDGACQLPVNQVKDALSQISLTFD